MKFIYLQAFQYLLAIGFLIAVCRIALRRVWRRSMRPLATFGDSFFAVSPGSATDALQSDALCHFATGTVLRSDDSIRDLGHAARPVSTAGPISRLLPHARSAGNGVRAASLEAALASREQELTSALHDLDVARSEMRRRNTHDLLTGALGHKAFRDALQQRVTRAQQTSTQISLLLLDLDGFRFLNDAYGHQTGDFILQHVAHLLGSRCGTSDLVARHSGDCFAVVLPGRCRESVTHFAEEIRTRIDAAGAPIGTGERVPLHSTIAVSVYPDDADSAHSLLVIAEAALKQGKRCGGNIVVTGGSGAVDLIGDTGPIMPNEALRTLDGLVRTVDAKDSYTTDHSNDVMQYAVMLAYALRLPESTIETLRVAAMLHDVGKIGIPDHILKKPGKLSPSEYATMQRHVELSEQIIRDVADQEDIVRAIGGHHERWDGHGYPRALKGEANPLPGRILAIADAFSAMTLDRPYRKALSFEEAFRRLRAGAGSQFDPSLVEPFITSLTATVSAGSAAEQAA
jgi:diguanylate cyclase (GGDEF)-like protein